MSKLVFVFPLLVIALIAIAIYVQVTSSSLSLPISTASTVLTILLPLFAAANVVCTPVLNRLVLNRLARSPALQQFLLPALHIIQGGLAIVIATLAAQGFVSGPTLDCRLENNWQLLWHNHDGRAIERIQNAFDCCGLHSVVDRAWPGKQCSEIYHRHTSCDAPWGAFMRRTSGLEFAVVVLAGIIQLAQLAYLRRRAARGNTAPVFKQTPRRVEEGTSEQLIEERYHDDDDEDSNESDADLDVPRPAISDARDNNVPRVQPSGLGRDEANEWQS